jgi:hypothetical protein
MNLERAWQRASRVRRRDASRAFRCALGSSRSLGLELGTPRQARKLARAGVVDQDYG